MLIYIESCMIVLSSIFYYFFNHELKGDHMKTTSNKKDNVKKQRQVKNVAATFHVRLDQLSIDALNDIQKTLVDANGVVFSTSALFRRAVRHYARTLKNKLLHEYEARETRLAAAGIRGDWFPTVKDSQEELKMNVKDCQEADE